MSDSESDFVCSAVAPPRAKVLLTHELPMAIDAFSSCYCTGSSMCRQTELRRAKLQSWTMTPTAARTMPLHSL